MNEIIFSVVILDENLNVAANTILSLQSYLGAGTYEIFLTFPKTNSAVPAGIDTNQLIFADSPNLNYAFEKIFKTAAGKYILFLSKGAILSRNALQKMSALLETNDKIGAVGPMLNHCHHKNVDYSSNLQLISAPPIKNSDELELLAEMLSARNIPNRNTLVLDGACILVRREAAEVIGVPDTNLGIDWDADYSLRILKAGFLVYICSAAYVHCASLDANPKWGGGGDTFKNKWGFNLMYNFQARLSLLKFLELGRPNLKILEIGCACGGTLMAIRDFNPAAELYGVELNEKTSEFARIFAEVVNADIEAYDNSQWENFFDVIILSDVIEHLHDSKSIMAKVHSWLKPGGRAIMSIPNVMNIEVLRNLLLHGRWEYADSGILDRTHLRFFTRKEILLLMLNSDFEIVNVSFTRQPFSEEAAILKNHLLSIANRGEVLNEDFEALQWQVLVSKPYQNSDADKIEYTEYIEKISTKRSDNFVPFNSEKFQRNDDDTKIIAYYLPQFHQMEINNRFHGQGFTEWTNTSRALPVFTGHYQPHIPYDVGYYDLNDPEALARQIYLAKHYGVYGFCFHYYWFSGTKIMEKPIELLLEHKELDIPFCISWANENWTSTWDGGNKNIMLQQNLNDGDDKKFMADILPFFKDKRYIKIDGKPLLTIYKPKTFQQQRLIRFFDSIRKIAKKNGFPDLYIMLSSAMSFADDVADWGADALVEYRALELPGAVKYRPKGYVNPNYKGRILDVSESLRQKIYLNQHKSKIFYRAALTSWDNTARKTDGGGLICTGYTPQTFKTWLKDIITESKKIHDKSNDIIFANSWNEWAEGSHIEPDMYYGYAFLQAIREALLESR